jgi:hypothetical protein
MVPPFGFQSALGSLAGRQSISSPSYLSPFCLPRCA